MRGISVFLAAGAVALTACGGGIDGVGERDTQTKESTPVDDTTTTTAAPFDIADVEASVVKIVAEGTFVDPEVGEQRNSAGVGSGMIISDDGLVVTNNHVVTGAALLRVTVPGLNGTVNAKVLGVSECNDLAVIQLEGSDYEPLEYRTEKVATGLAVYAAGYPASDASTIDEVDYTLTRGIVSSTTATGESSWASVDSVLEHDARIRGGNSGGPLVDESGQIVGVNYAGIDESGQNYAIAIADALPIIEQLSAGEDVLSIGINGQAVLDTESGLSGVWVASVDSGSPADNAEIKPGDIITALEGLDIATDGTMNDYCDVIRTKGADATMRVEVLRFSTEEVYEGQLNGKPLELSFSFAEEFSEDVGTDDPVADAETYTDYVSVSDDSGVITLEIPAEWSEVNGTNNENFGPSVYAAPDLEVFLAGYDVPGVIIEATSDRGADDVEATLDESDFSDDCTYAGRNEYFDGLYTGFVDVYNDCGPSEASLFVIAVAPEDGSFVARLLIQATELRDLDAADQIINTFIADL